MSEVQTVAASIYGEREIDGPKGFFCTGCGRAERFGAYVYAHWDIELVHTCECGQQHTIVEGHAYPIAGGA